MSVRRGGQFSLTVTRVQFGLAPSKAGTYNNAQGKTIREADGSALGHCIDLTRPDYFTHDEYTQHVYMILGRARSMQWSLFRNLPTTADGDVDFAVSKMARLRTLHSSCVSWRRGAHRMM